MNVVSGYIKGHFIFNLMTKKNTENERRVFYICHHDEHGAMGFIINQVVDHVKFSDIDWTDHPESLYQMQGSFEMPVFWGGPHEPNRGFILHSMDCTMEQTLSINAICGLTRNLDLLKKTSPSDIPRHYILFLGHLNWGPGELEKELIHKPWVAVPGNYRTLFEVPAKEKWLDLLRSLAYPKCHFQKAIIPSPEL